MRLNKTVKALAVALPIMALTACSSSSDTGADSQVDTNSQVDSSVTQNDNAEAIAAKRKQEIAEEKARQMAVLRGNHIVYFDFDKSTFSSEFEAILDAHAKYLSENSNVSVLIEGHADERGTPEYNIALGERRAKAVVKYLENMGVSSSQLSVVSYGEEKPMVKDRSESAFAKNRRAVIVY